MQKCVLENIICNIYSSYSRFTTCQYVKNRYLSECPKYSYFKCKCLKIKLETLDKAFMLYRKCKGKSHREDNQLTSNGIFNRSVHLQGIHMKDTKACDTACFRFAEPFTSLTQFCNFKTRQINADIALKPDFSFKRAHKHG